MFEAAGPFGPSTTSKDTAWLSFSDLYPAIWILLWWANRSLPPSSGVMNPKPLESLNHFTVPVGMSFPYLEIARLSEPHCGHDDQGRNGLPLRRPLLAIWRGHVSTT